MHGEAGICTGRSERAVSMQGAAGEVSSGRFACTGTAVIPHRAGPWEPAETPRR